MLRPDAVAFAGLLFWFIAGRCRLRQLFVRVAIHGVAGGGHHRMCPCEVPTGRVLANVFGTSSLINNNLANSRFSHNSCCCCEYEPHLHDNYSDCI